MVLVKFYSWRYIIVFIVSTLFIVIIFLSETYLDSNILSDDVNLEKPVYDLIRA